MNARSFAEGFDYNSSDYDSLTSDELRSRTRSLMEGPQRWSRYFSHLLSSHLLDEPLDSEAVAQNIHTYTSDAHRQSIRSISTAMEDIAFHYPSVVSNTNKLNFHSINQDLAPYWLRLVDPEAHPAPDYIDIAVMQARLSVRALQLVKIRQRFYEQTLLHTPEPTEEDLELDAAFAGRITEHEAPIAILQMLKEKPAEDRENLVLLAGPGRFESGRKEMSRASDFVYLDTEAAQVAGVQVKTVLRGTRSYDRDYVTFIDGFKDLGNSANRQLTDGSVAKRAAPGLLAADFILNSEALQRQSSYSRIKGLQGIFGQILDAKEFARTLPEPADGLSNRAQVAAARIEDRLEHALYKDE